MNELNDNPNKLSRRDALKALIAAGGATTLATLPDRWEQPIVQAASLPAFAQTSPGQFPFSNEIESIEFEGAPASDFQFAVQPGWIIVAPTGTTVGPLHYGYPWILGRPWLKIKRRFQVFVPPGLWGVLSIRIKIKFRFFPLPGFGSSNNIIDDTEFWAFVISGANLNLFQYYVKKFKMNKNKVEVVLELPLIVSGFWPFYISCIFPNNIPLLGGGSLFPGYYLGPGCFGDSVSTSFLNR
jgi:hypothetical protein